MIWILLNRGSRSGGVIGPRIEAWLDDSTSESSAPFPRPRILSPAELAESAELPERLIAVGGDGTVNLALTHLQDRGATIPLGIVPAGTGNNLARGLGLPLEVEEALAIAVHSSALRSIDAAVVDGEEPGSPGNPSRTLLVQVGGLGFPADVAGDYDRMRRHRLTGWILRWLGDAAYRVLALRRLLATRRSSRSVRCRLDGELLGGERVDGESITAQCLGLFIANEGTVGGGFRPSPGALLDDGRLELVIAIAPRFRDARALFGAISRGEHLEKDSNVGDRFAAGSGGAEIIARSFTKSLVIELDAPAALLVDGDLPLVSSRYSFEVLPHRFPIIVCEPRSD